MKTVRGGLKEQATPRFETFFGADLGCSSIYSKECVGIEDRIGEGFRVDRKGAWVSRTSVTYDYVACARTYLLLNV